MEITALAEQVLFGTHLDDKLVETSGLTDERPGGITRLPELPGRPDTLRPSAERHRMPSANALEDPAMCGRLLHAFANHELLAMELMALALLRWPEAPAAFRRGLAYALREEQRHLKGYLERLAAYGTTFGSEPVNDFFWRWMYDLPTPKHFVAHLSLTFEQANLDFAAFYRSRFSELGDLETASLFRIIEDDEIGHVKLGRVWFNKWRDPDKSEWDAYCETLRAPLSPARAKGLGFNREARRRVGFPERYIDKLEVYSHSKGRPPNVFWFNPDCEDEVAAGTTAAGTTYAPNKAVNRLTRDLEATPMFVCAADDIVLVREAPSVAFLQPLQTAGVAVPEFAVGAEGEAGVLQRKLGTMHPWGWTPSAGRRAEKLRDACLHPERSPGWSEGRGVWYSKPMVAALVGEWLRRQRQDGGASLESDVASLPTFDEAGVGCRTIDEVQRATHHLFELGHERVVVKRALSAAGRHRIFLRPGEELGLFERDWLGRVLTSASSGAALKDTAMPAFAAEVLVQPWLDKLVDLSCVGVMDADGSIHMDGTTRFFTDPRGKYLGALVGRPFDDFREGFHRALSQRRLQGRQLERPFRALMGWLGPRLREQGYWGPLGLDGCLYRDLAGEVRLHPGLELNTRFTMGHVARRLERLLWRGVAGLWLLLPVRDLKRAGHATPAAFAEALSAQRPTTLRHSPRAHLTRGVLFTNDPAKAGVLLGTLVVDESLEACIEHLSAVGLDNLGLSLVPEHI